MRCCRLTGRAVGPGNSWNEFSTECAKLGQPARLKAGDGLSLPLGRREPERDGVWQRRRVEDDGGVIRPNPIRQKRSSLQIISLDLPVQRRAFDAQNSGGLALVPVG